MKDQTIYLRHILESIEAIERYTQGITRRQFLRPGQVQDAIIRRLEIIGEAGRHLSETTLEQLSTIDWQGAKGMRNFLIHEYFGVDLPLVWIVVQKKLPLMKEAISVFLKNK